MLEKVNHDPALQDGTWKHARRNRQHTSEWRQALAKEGGSENVMGGMKN